MVMLFYVNSIKIIINHLFSQLASSMDKESDEEEEEF